MASQNSNHNPALWGGGQRRGNVIMGEDPRLR